MECCECVSTGSSLGDVFEPLGMNDGFEVKQSAFKDFVDYNEVEFFGLGLSLIHI